MIMTSEIKSTVADRAYAMAEMWANDHERLAAMIATRLQPAELAEICEYLAKSFQSISDDGVPREKTYRDCFTSLLMIHGIVVERVFLPVAEGLARTDHDEKTWAAGFAPIQVANAERAELRRSA